MSHISVVVPVYKAEDCLLELYRRLVDSLQKITSDFEIILVEDCGGDKSWDLIKELANQDQRVKGIQFSRNFGQHFGIAAGLNHSNGDWIVVMDCDLQDQPEEIPRLYEKAQQGYDIVLGRRVERKDSFLKRWGSRIYYKVFDYFTETNSDYTIASFGMCARKVIDCFKKLEEQNRPYHLFLQWMGFKTTFIEIDHAPRYAGKSSYSLRKMIKLATDNIMVMSNKPLKIFIKFGFTLSLLAMLYGFYLIIRYVFFEQPIMGWTSVMVSVYFIGGLIFANLGILGLYIGRIYDETKKRPIYIIREAVGLDEEKTV